MNKKEKTKENICAFYASDYHFEMLSLPYINRKIEENKEIVILTENNLSDTIKILTEKINLNENKKEKILKIDWKNDDFKKFKKIKEDAKNKKDTVIFIKGKENYIKNINENISNWTKNMQNVKIIDCYDITEISNNLDEIMNNYKTILGTSGEKEINKL